MTPLCDAPRFSGPPAESDDEILRWREYAWLIARKNDVETLIAALNGFYPLLATPNAIDDACELLEQVGDLLRRRASKLDESE